jgi:folate-dependent phosphoribosylglycinamide formyltransferase PurN
MAPAEIPESQTDQGQPIRVVLFGGGPVLERGVKEFICRMEEHREIELLGAFIESRARTATAVVKDLFRRRRLMAVPVLILMLAGTAIRYLAKPRNEIRLNRKIASMSARLQYVPDVHAEEVLRRVSALSPDLGVAYSCPILKAELFQIPKFGTLGIHHGKVPEYRGKKTTFWAMYNGEKSVGVTIQKINPGLDTGDVVRAGEVAVSGRSLRAVWKELEQLGFDLFIDAILDVKHQKAVYRPQTGAKGRLYRDPEVADILTFWWKSIKKSL